MIFKMNKKHLLLWGIDTLTFMAVYLFSVLLEAITSENLNYEYIEKYFVRYLINFTLFYTLIFVARYIAKVYRNVWKYADSLAYLELVFADAIGGAVALILSRIIDGATVGGWYNVATIAMFNCASLALRFVYQQYYKMTSRNSSKFKDNKISVAIVGAGKTGATLADELMNSKSSHYRPMCFIDNNPAKNGARILGLPVYKEDNRVFAMLEDLGVQEIFIAVPTLTATDAKDMFDRYSATGCKVKLYDFARNTNSGYGDNEKRMSILRRTAKKT